MNKNKIILILIALGIYANTIYAVSEANNSNGIFVVLVCSLISIVTANMYINSVKRADEEVRRKRSEAAKKAAKTREKNKKLKEKKEKNKKVRKENK